MDPSFLDQILLLLDNLKKNNLGLSDSRMCILSVMQNVLLDNVRHLHKTFLSFGSWRFAFYLMMTVAGIAFLYDVSCLCGIFDENLSSLFKLPACDFLRM